MIFEIKIPARLLADARERVKFFGQINLISGLFTSTPSTPPRRGSGSRHVRLHLDSEGNLFAILTVANNAVHETIPHPPSGV